MDCSVAPCQGGKLWFVGSFVSVGRLRSEDGVQGFLEERTIERAVAAGRIQCSGFEREARLSRIGSVVSVQKA